MVLLFSIIIIVLGFLPVFESNTVRTMSILDPTELEIVIINGCIFLHDILSENYLINAFISSNQKVLSH